VDIPSGVKVLPTAILAFVVVVVVAVAGAVAYATTGDSRREGCSLASFDTCAWADESSSDGEPSRGPSTHQRLADDLIECETLQGARRARSARCSDALTTRGSGHAPL